MASILCIEDESDIRELLSDELSSAGHEVIPACNGTEALTKLAFFVPDLILSDISMPEMDGYELLESVRSQYPQLADTPFIFLTAFSSREEEMKARSKGVDDFISKPVDFDLLLSTLSTRLEQVARMRNRRDKQFVKLYNALTSPTAAQAPTQPEVQTELVNTSSEESSSGTAPARATKSDKEGAPPKNRTVYGTIFRFPNLRRAAEETGAEYQALWGRIRSNANELLKLLLFDEVVVSETSDDGLFITHRSSSKDEAEEESERLYQALRESLIEDQKNNFNGHSLRPELVENALFVSKSLFEMTISREEFPDPKQYKQAVMDVVKQAREDERAPSLLTNSMREDGASLHPLALVTSEADTLPVRFFDYDAQSKRKMRASFALFSREHCTKAGYLIDALSLEMLDPAARQIGPKDIVVADVNFDTLASESFAPLYARKLQSFLKNCGHSVMTNIRSIPPGITGKHIDVLFKRLKKNGARRSVQVKPEAIADFINERLPVNCIVVSYTDLKADSAALDLLAKAGPHFKESKTLLILRGIPSRKEIPQFNRYGFHGYAIELAPESND